MKTPAPSEFLATHLQTAAVPPEPRRLELLVRLLSARSEAPGQVLGIFHSDCGLARSYWLELQSAKANAWLGLHEALVARPRDELRRWIESQRAAAVTLDAAAAAVQERERYHALRRAFVADHLFADGWSKFDPGTDTERGVLGVRSVFDRYILMLRERVFLTNLGVLAFGAWFRAPVEKVEGLDQDALRAALEERWAASVAQFPALTAAEDAWTNAYQQAGGLFPAEAEIERQILVLMRRAGITAKPVKTLQFTRG